MSQCQYTCQSPRGDNTQTTDSPLSSAPVGPENHFGLSEDTASQPVAVVPTPSTEAQPPSTKDAFSISCPGSNADTMNISFLSSETPDHTLGESNVSMSPHSMSPSITNSEDTSNTTQLHTSAAATSCNRPGGDIVIIPSNPSRLDKGFSILSPSSHQALIAGEGSSSSDSLTAQIAADDDSTESSPSTQNVDCASMYYQPDSNAELAQPMLVTFDNIYSCPGTCVYLNMGSLEMGLAH